jgi:hypothetical protein
MAIQTNHELRDPVHGMVLLTDQELKIVDTKAFQRLRRIKQLAMADLVYPGALHTRLEHSLGTLHSAHRILTRLDQLERLCEHDHRIVRLSALLHDIGHGPFRHVSEYLLDRHADRSVVAEGTVREKIHEKVTVDIIKEHHEIANLLSESEIEDITQIIQGTNLRDFRRDIVSSSLDADKIDYLSRDTYYTGVKYGVFDMDKVVGSFLVHSSGDESFLAISESGLFAVEQLILAKHHMIQQVYAHRVRTITDTMIVRGLELAIDEDVPGIRELYSYDGSQDYINRYLEYHDDKVISILADCDFEHPREIFQRLLDRRLYKELVLLPIDDRNVRNDILLHRLMTLSRDAITELEGKIADHINCEPWEVIVQRKNIKNPAYYGPGEIDPETIYVIPHGSYPRSLGTYVELVSSKIPRYERLHVIAPYEWPEQSTDEDLKNLKDRVQDEIVEIIFDSLEGGS